MKIKKEEIKLCPKCHGKRLEYFTPFERQGDARSGGGYHDKYEICELCGGLGTVLEKTTIEYSSLADFDFKRFARNYKGI
jgi:DnaJ-class molecular chaperone